MQALATSACHSHRSHLSTDLLLCLLRLLTTKMHRTNCRQRNLRFPADGQRVRADWPQGRIRLALVHMYRLSAIVHHYRPCLSPELLHSPLTAHRHDQSLAQFRYKLPPTAPDYLYTDKDTLNHVDWKLMKVSAGTGWTAHAAGRHVHMMMIVCLSACVAHGRHAVCGRCRLAERGLGVGQTHRERW